MEIKNRIGIIAVFFTFTSLTVAQQQLRLLDCFGTQIIKAADSTVYSDLRAWVDTAQDTAHWIGSWAVCNPAPTCNPIFPNCNPITDCQYAWIWPVIHGRLVNDRITSIEKSKIYDIWAADLNATFHLKRLYPTFIEDTVSFTVDSTNNYLIGPYPWLTKAEIVALSKKCYIDHIGWSMVPVANRRVPPLSGKRTQGEAFNGNGQKLDRTKSGVYYLRPKP